MKKNKGPIGIFDSGYGGLTVFKTIAKHLPQYNYCYLGDNARAPYGPRSFDTIYDYTLEAVQYLFAQGCPLVILACNTASAKALRTIQQQDLPKMDDPRKRVLGVVRPTTERVGEWTKTGKVGILATTGTVRSESYRIEIERFFPKIDVFQQACPMFVPLIENNEHDGEGSDFFVQKYLDALFLQSKDIDTLLLGCTHYPLILPKLEAYLAQREQPILLHTTAQKEKTIHIISQGDIVAHSLVEYLERHPEMEKRLLKGSKKRFCTTGDTADFNAQGSVFFGKKVVSEKVVL